MFGEIFRSIKKSSNVRKLTKEYLNTMPHWQYIKFDYNINNLDVAKNIAIENNLGFIEIDSNR